MTYNISRLLEENASKHPFKEAVIYPAGRDTSGRVLYSRLNYRQLNESSSILAKGFLDRGMAAGDRVLMMVNPSLEFYEITWALFKIGAVPVMIDPGMGPKHFLKCVQKAEPQGMVGILKAQVLKALCSSSFKTTKYNFYVGKAFFPGATSLNSIRKGAPIEHIFESEEDSLAAILYTSGSTGPPKGVCYSHGIFDTQVRWIREVYQIGEDEKDLPGFPLFGLFSSALGMTAVIPDMDPSRPAQVDPLKVIEAIKNFGITNSFGSPAFWRSVSNYCVPKKIQFPTLKRILMAGAPAPGPLLRNIEKILPSEAEVFTPYGATESLPVASIGHKEILSETWSETDKGKGVCVGKPLPEMDVRIISIEDGAITEFKPELEVSQGTLGEIIVKGPVVTRGYFQLDEANKKSKIKTGTGFYHRMGDIGYFDDKGRLWFCGRKDHRVKGKDKTWFSVCVEAKMNTHSKVFRSALVGIKEKPYLIVELERGNRSSEALKKELLQWAQSQESSQDVVDIFFHPSFPVDVRHNSKIKREVLKEWLEKKTS